MPTSTTGYSSTNLRVAICARASDGCSTSKLSNVQCRKRFGMRDCCSSTSARPVFLHLQGRTPLPSTNSQPVPPHDAHATGFKLAASGNIPCLLVDNLRCDDLPEWGSICHQSCGIIWEAIMQMQWQSYMARSKLSSFFHARRSCGYQ